MTRVLEHIAARRAPSRRPGLVLPTLLAVTVAVAACDGNPFQVIEETTFDPSLGVNLAEMERLPTGVYYQDLLVGTGNRVGSASNILVAYEGYLANGAKFGEGEFRFILGQRQVIAGFEQGVIGMNEGGERKIVIPPELGYGEEEQDAIPAGSILVFDVRLTEVSDPGGQQ